MMPMKAKEIAAIVKGDLFAPEDCVISQGASFDSREVIPGSIFLALKGEHVDGHDFANDALSHGAAIVLASRKISGPCIVVENVIDAVGLLAGHIRASLPDLQVIAITGSQGKTTTKDLLMWVLALNKETIAARASFNNELGVALTLLDCSKSTRYCVVEMGARHPGDIAALAKMAKPNIGVVLKVGSAHVGEFGSIEAIASTKAELIGALPDDAIAILGLYDSFTPKMAQGRKLRVFNFGEVSHADIRATDIEMREGRAHFDLVTPQGRAAVGLRLVGSHQIANALACAGVATALNISLDTIAGGLSTAEVASKWRMQIHELPDLLVINDSYNANPDSTREAIKTIAAFAQERGGQSWVFLGKMHELGESSEKEHASIGKIAAEMGIDHLVCVGAPEYASDLGVEGQMSVHICQSKGDALELLEHFASGDVVLVKASRAERMEELANQIIVRWNEKVEMSQ